MRQFPFRNALVLFAIMFLSACGGGGGGDGGSYSSLSPEGNYFPYDEGNRWGYQALVSTNGVPRAAYLEFLKVTDSEISGGEIVSAVEEFNPANASLFGGYYTVRGDGLYYDEGTDGEDLFGLGTYKIANLPLQTNDTFTQIDRSGLDFGQDLDGDGINEALSLLSHVRVVGLESVTVPAGDFADCVILQTDITEILTLSGSGERLVVTVLLKEWYARDLGAVKRIYQLSGDGFTETEEFSLESYYVDGRGSDETAPEVVSARPTGTTGENPAPSISVQFSEDMDPTTFTTATFSLLDPLGQQVAGDVVYANRTATFYPSAALGSAIYTATLSSDVEDLAGNRLAASFTWEFTLDATAPEIVETFPADQAMQVDRAISLTVSFNEELNPSTINSSTFRFVDSGGNSVYGNITYENRTATFTPRHGLLERGKTYTATISGTVQDSYGNNLQADYSWSFTVDPGLFSPYLSIPTGAWPEAVAIGDVNGDGRNDVVMTTSYYFDPENDYKLFVFLQDIDGALLPAVKYPTSATYSTRPETVAIGDVNHDGREDIVVGNSGAGIEVFLQDSGGSLAPAVSYESEDSDKVKIADLNGDGLLDVVGIGWGTDTVSVFPQKADGTLGAPEVSSVTHGGYDDLEVGDVNDDGLADVVVMSGQSWVPNLGILLQSSSGALSPPDYYGIGELSLARGVGVGDVNGDNLADVIVSGGGNRPGAGIHVFSQNLSGSLDPAASYLSYDIPEPLEVADVDGDGRKDIVTLHGGWGAMGVYLQDADGQLLEEELFTIPYASHYNPHGLALGDIDSDGYTDAVLADYNNGLVLLYNAYEPPPISAPLSTSLRTVAPRSFEFKGVRLR